MRHELKAWPEPYRALLDGAKTCEVRKDDRGYAVGDELLLREFAPCVLCLGRGTTGEVIWTLNGNAVHPECPKCEAAKGRFTGLRTLVEVTHVQRGFGLPDGLVVLSVKKLGPGWI